MERERIVCFVDGFNLYHAIDKLQKPHLKWLDLSLLLSRFARPKSQEILDIYYFSAYPTWKAGSYQRHRKYVSALIAKGVTPVMGHFKNKDRSCLQCGAKWVAHEEKESDVNLALALLDLGYKDKYDHAFIVSRDSDIAPAVRKVRRNFPKKQITVFSPFNYRHSTELIQATTHHKTIKYKHIRTSLLPEEIYDVGGNLVVRRPEKYDPPNNNQF